MHAAHKYGHGGDRMDNYDRAVSIINWRRRWRSTDKLSSSYSRANGYCQLSLLDSLGRTLALRSNRVSIVQSKNQKLVLCLSATYLHFPKNFRERVFPPAIARLRMFMQMCACFYECYENRSRAFRRSFSAFRILSARKFAAWQSCRMTNVWICNWNASLPEREIEKQRGLQFIRRGEQYGGGRRGCSGRSMEIYINRY